MSKEKNKKAKEEEILEKEANEEIKEAEVTEEPKAEEPAADKKDEEIAKLKDQLLRNMAEYDNYRKRTSRERMELEPEITAKVVAEFLPVIDSIERALSHECSDENYKKGIKMIYDNFMETMSKLGVEQIAAEGDFDPSIHQAVQQVQSDELESGKIATTFQKGYKIGNKVIRFAMVAVVA